MCAIWLLHVYAKGSEWVSGLRKLRLKINSMCWGRNKTYSVPRTFFLYCQVHTLYIAIHLVCAHVCKCACSTGTVVGGGWLRVVVEMVQARIICAHMFIRGWKPSIWDKWWLRSLIPVGKFGRVYLYNLVLKIYMADLHLLHIACSEDICSE